MNVTEAQYTDETQTAVRVVVDGITHTVTIGADNFYARLLATWTGQGNTITAYVAPEAYQQQTELLEQEVKDTWQLHLDT